MFAKNPTPFQAPSNLKNLSINITIITNNNDIKTLLYFSTPLSTPKITMKAASENLLLETVAAKTNCVHNLFTTPCVFMSQANLLLSLL